MRGTHTRRPYASCIMGALEARLRPRGAALQMGRHLIKLILTDLDETLIHFGLTRATDHAIAAIRRAQAAGVTFAATTGRIRQGACAAFGFARECTQSAVMSNGQLVLADGQLIGQVELDREGMERLAAELVGDRNFMLNVITRAETMEPVRVIVSDDPDAAKRAFRADSDDVVVMDHLPDGPLVKSNIHVMGGVDRMGEVRERLEALCPGIRLMSPGPQVPMFDVAPKDWSKAKGAELLRRHLGIGVDEVAAFGDAENDLELLGFYPNSVAVANAVPEVASAARWHIGASADDAVADAIEDIARASAEGRMPDFMCEAANERGLAMRARPAGDRKVESLPYFRPRA